MRFNRFKVRMGHFMPDWRHQRHQFNPLPVRQEG
jgi:hypothetical protein